jgi:hypothetical protein
MQSQGATEIENDRLGRRQSFLSFRPVSWPMGPFSLTGFEKKSRIFPSFSRNPSLAPKVSLLKQHASTHTHPSTSHILLLLLQNIHKRRNKTRTHTLFPYGRKESWMYLRVYFGCTQHESLLKYSVS